MNPDNVPQGEHLKKYCQDLTQYAKDGKLDPIIGRDDEIRRTIRVLSRRTKNNPVLIGNPGVGKTAIAEGIHSYLQLAQYTLLSYTQLNPLRSRTNDCQKRSTRQYQKHKAHGT